MHKITIMLKSTKVAELAHKWQQIKIVTTKT